MAKNNESIISSMLGRKIGRKEFFLANLFLVFIAVSVHYLIRYTISIQEIGLIKYAVLKNALSVIYLALLMPFVLGRLRDISASAWWSLLFWASLPIRELNILLAQEMMGVQINFAALPIAWDIALKISWLVVICAAILSLVLLFKPSSHNNSLQPTSAITRHLG